MVGELNEEQSEEGAPLSSHFWVNRGEGSQHIRYVEGHSGSFIHHVLT